MPETEHTPRMSPAGAKPAPGPKRIYDVAGAVPVDGGHAIQLDGRNVRTPARRMFVVPGAAMAEAIVAEWMAQGEHVDHQAMPITRFANTALDNVRGREDVIVDEIATFAGNDLLCYRSETPDSLVEAQMTAWDPVISWAEETFSVKFKLTTGVIHVPQPAATLAGMQRTIGGHDAFVLTALHNLTTLTGSALLALATAQGFLEPGEAWQRAHVDEDWQISRWGTDEEAVERRAYRGGEFLAAHRLLTLHGGA